MPYFEMSHSSVGALEVVTFTADPTNIVGTVVNWDFGDGEHCEQCPLTVTHRYSRTGTFPVRLTATEPVCGGAQVSFPQYLAVGTPPLRDDALIVGDTIPACVQPGQPVTAFVTVRNVGGTTWEVRHGHELRRTAGGAVVGQSAFALPTGRIVPPGAIVDFPVDVGAPEALAEQVVGLQMGNVHGLFGDAITSRVRVSPACSSAQPKIGDYTCKVQISTPGGFGMPNVAVRLVAQAVSELGTSETSDFGLTDSDGIAHLAVNRGSLPVHRLACSLSGIETTEAPFVVVADPLDIAAPHHLDLVRTVRQTFASNVRLVGLKTNVIASARLYQSGSYDRPVVIPAPFKRDEQDHPYTDESLYELFEPFVRLANRDGLDIWLMRTTVGQNIHEQSAEFAQLIDYAARRMGPEGKVVAAGYSLGGINTRMTTARYQADATWRSDLLIQRHDLPVSLVAFADAPLAGANIPYAFQSVLWEQLSPNGRGLPYSQLPQAMAKVNLNTCGAQQLLQRSYPSVSSNFDRFWNTGDPVRFPNIGNPGGVCDRVEGNECVCDGGPAVLSINGDGWAHGVRTVAYSDGNPGPQGCFGILGSINLDWDRQGGDVCRDQAEIYPAGRPFFPSPGDRMFKVKLPLASDGFVLASPFDLAPGSRLSLSAQTECQDVAGIAVCGGVEKQYFSPTFIPFDSALPPGPFARTWWTPDFQGVHANSPGTNVRTWVDEALLSFGPVSPTLARPEASTQVSGALDQSIVVSFPYAPASLSLSASLSSEGPPLPQGLVMAQGSGYYQIESNFNSIATRNDPIEVCISYGSTNFMDATQVRLFHHDGAHWEDATSFRDREERRICAVTTSLSPFAILEPANSAPVAPNYLPVVLEATGPEGSEAVLLATGFLDRDGDALSYTWSGEPSQTGAVFRSTLPIGVHSISVIGSDRRGGQATAAHEVTVRDTTRPAVGLTASGDVTRTFTAFATDLVGVVALRITLDGETVAEASQSGLTHILDTRLISDGTHEVRAVAEDAAGNQAVSAHITLAVDNTPPGLSLSATPALLWPPNGRLIPVTIAIDVGDAIDPTPTVRLVSVSCAEILRGAGVERPCVAGEIQGATLGVDDRSLALRARRSGDVDRRVYLIVYTARDRDGNEATRSVSVLVPHDRR